MDTLPNRGAVIDTAGGEVSASSSGLGASSKRRLPNGRWILVTDRRTPDGGTVGIRTDITT